VTKKNIVIASIARNIGDTFQLDYSRISASFSDYNILKWIIVESNSNDNSIEVLRKYAQSHDCLHIEILKEEVIPSGVRTEKMANARNKYIEILNKIKETNNVSYLVVCDLNNLNKKLDVISVRSCFQNNENWAAVTANQDGPYYDIWALRHKYWNNYDCWERYEALKAIYPKSSLALWDSVYSRMIKIHKNSTWIKVDSAFGGVAIYDINYISNCNYVGLDANKKQICEHISFNNGIVKNGGSIYINPKFINFKLTDHSKRKKYFKYYNLKFYAAKIFKSKLYN
jgi:hypothetical protein